MEHSKRSLFVLFCIVFLDMLGVGIVIPILASLFLDTTGGIFSPSTSFGVRTFVLGLLIAAYSATQFLGAPILGGLSDHYGRKKIFLLSLIGTFLGYALFALGITLENLPLLFFSRLLSGFTGGNISIALSSIADVSDEKVKAKNFGLVGMAFGLGFIIGPYVGGKLADPAIISWFTYATPFWFAALLSVLNFFSVLFAFRETITIRSTAALHLFTAFHNIKKAFTLSNLRVLFSVVFLIVFGFTFFTQFFQVFLIDKFNFTQSDIGNLFAYVGIWIVFTQGVLMRFAFKNISSVRMLRFSLLALALFFPLIIISPSSSYLFLVLPFIAIAHGLTIPHITALVSQAAGKESQGEILGINQSILSLAQAVPPVIAGLVVSLHTSLPILVAGFTTLCAWGVFILFFSEQQKTVFHEVE